ncbi:MAG TPA: gephyrin-like molybdotransferase Glp [Pirellulales bacterium]|nr:gephyrin-like molybdotransferase Glp [Pirellulales bacterium]
MLSVEEALRLVVEHAQPLAARRVGRSNALGRVLAEDVASDIDSPPFDRSTVEGYALRAADLTGGVAELRVLEEVVAGALPMMPVEPGAATRVMTGAPIPAGADAVVMIERSQLVARGDSAERVRIDEPRCSIGQNIARRASAMRVGQIVIARGQSLRSVEIGLLAEVGRDDVMVVPSPQVSVVATGNELVDPAVKPNLGQIRNSNGSMLAAAAAECGAHVLPPQTAHDDRDTLRHILGPALEAADVLVVSGGVSVGVLDLVPATLESLGVEQVFHKVRAKPGKPVWFGVHRSETRTRLVFGLPGNPLSSFVGFQLFVRPAIRRLQGRSDLQLQETTAKLEIAFTNRGDRETYVPSRMGVDQHGATIRPVGSTGSGDLASMARADALMRLPGGTRTYEAGSSAAVLLLPAGIGS